MVEFIMYTSNDRSAWVSQIIKQHSPRMTSIIELGCNDGATLHGIIDNKLFPLEKVHGVDYADTSDKLIEDDDFTVFDLNNDVDGIKNLIYNSDVILLLDVLEHLYSPEEFLLNLKKVKRVDSMIIISVPNHSSVRMLLAWLRNEFPRDDIGFFDQTHRSWFSLKSITEIALNHYDIVDKGYIRSNKFWYKLMQFISPSRFCSQLYVVIK
jgi:2-polyprenyl-3-methyl-5-hydroxy-6-metoxy-1,4-benzoquinol methylase